MSVEQEPSFLHRLHNLHARYAIVPALILAGAIACSHPTASPLDGWWIKASGGSDFPDQLTIKAKAGHLRMRYPDSADVLKLDLLTDGQTHQVQPTSAFMFAHSYSAKVNGGVLELTKTRDTPNFVSITKNLPPTSAVTERWTVSDDGRQLTVSVGITPDTIYTRASLGRRLFQSPP